MTTRCPFRRMRSWVNLPSRPVLTVVLALVWAGCLWIFYYPGTEAKAPHRTFAYQRYADASLLITLVREDHDPYLATVCRFSPDLLLKEAARVFDRATEKGVFPRDAALNWAVLFLELGDRERAEKALNFSRKNDDKAGSTGALLARLIAGTADLPADELKLLATKYREQETTQPDWYLLALHGEDHEVLAWLEDRGHRMIRRGVVADGILVLFFIASVLCLLWILFRRRSFVPYPVQDRLERSWGSWVFFRQFVIAELLALFAATLLSIPFHAGGSVGLAVLIAYLSQSFVLLVWMMSCLMPGLRAGLVHFLPEFRNRPRTGFTPNTRRLGRSLVAGMAGLAWLLFACYLMQFSHFGIESLEDSLRFDSLDGLPSISVSFFASVVLAPFTEEIIFRGFLFGALRARLGPVLAAVISSAIFAAVHGYSFAGLVFVFLFGLIFAAIYQRSGSLLPGMIAHGLLNLILTSGLVGWYSLH